VKIIDDALLDVFVLELEPLLLELLLELLVVQLPGKPAVDGHVWPELQFAIPCHVPELQDLVVRLVTHMFVPVEYSLLLWKQLVMTLELHHP